MLYSKTFKPNSNTYSFLFRLFDLFIIFLSLSIASALYGVTLTREYLIAGLIVAVVFLYLAEIFTIYPSWRQGSFSEMMLTAWASLGLSFLVLTAAAFAFKQSAELSRMTIGLWFISSSSLFLLWRLLNQHLRKVLRKSGFNVKKVAILGATSSGQHLLSQIQHQDELGYEFVGFYEDRALSRVPEELHRYIKGNFEQVLDMARCGEMDILFIALPLKAEERIADILVKVGDTTVDVHFIPDFFMSNLMHARIGHVGKIDTLSVFESPYHGAKQWLKRSEDLFFASVILLLISVPLLFIAIGVKLTSKGPVLFKQRRYGLNGEEILVWKFRSMKVMENNDKVVQATKGDEIGRAHV